MSTHPTSAPPALPGIAGEPLTVWKHERWIHRVTAAAIVVLAAVGLLVYSEARHNRQAVQKAVQLEQRFKQAGLTVPVSRDDIVRSLGTDGGAVCANPSNALGNAMLYDVITNGADFAGRRAVIVARRILLGEYLVLETYCREKAKAYQNKLKSLNLTHTSSG